MGLDKKRIFERIDAVANRNSGAVDKVYALAEAIRTLSIYSPEYFENHGPAFANILDDVARQFSVEGVCLKKLFESYENACSTEKAA